MCRKVGLLVFWHLSRSQIGLLVGGSHRHLLLFGLLPTATTVGANRFLMVIVPNPLLACLWCMVCRKKGQAT